MKTHPYSISKKYSNFAEVASEPLFNYLDVSDSANLLATSLTQDVMDTS